MLHGMTPKELVALARPLTHRLPIVAGIYLIHCSANDKVYIGSSLRVQARFTHHRHDLKIGRHDNAHLQKTYIKYGKETLTYLLVEEVPRPTTPEILLERENHYLLQLDRKDVFNVVIPAVLSMVGFKRDPANIAALAAFNRGNKYAKGLVVSPEIRAAVSARFKGKKHTPEQIANRVATRKANTAANPARRQIGERAANVKLTEKAVLEIRLRRAAGEKQVVLAREFNVTEATISAIVRRESWTHV